MKWIYNNQHYESNDVYMKDNHLYAHLGEFSRSIPPEKYYDIFPIDDIKIEDFGFRIDEDEDELTCEFKTVYYLGAPVGHAETQCRHSVDYRDCLSFVYCPFCGKKVIHGKGKKLTRDEMWNE